MFGITERWFSATDGAPMSTDEELKISFPIGAHRCPIGGERRCPKMSDGVRCIANLRNEPNQWHIPAHKTLSGNVRKRPIEPAKMQNEPNFDLH
jgi:hypothetical protein